ncbi:cell division protein Fic [Bacteroidia bacterium]|nr:cell division protein Fic [Bacteroidia bacterium]
MIYNWQNKNWANFTYNHLAINDIISCFVEFSNEMKVALQKKNIAEQQEEMLYFLISEAEKTSEIEGEHISRQDLMSSIRNKLGINPMPENVKDRRAKGVADLLIEVRNSYKKRLAETAIKNWHRLLFDGSKAVRAGKYRTDNAPMQVVSGAIGREIVHYEAPPSECVPQEMKNFVQWYNAFEVKNTADILIKTSIAHLYFESIHPFEDGNGRIGRAIAEKCLSQSLGSPVLFSISTIIEKNRKQYYNALKSAQNSLEISEWITYFAGVILQAQTEAVLIIKFSLYKTTFFDKYNTELNERELKAINKMFDAGFSGFEGGMTAKKYMSITHASKATTTRDLQHLAAIGVFVAQGSGRNVHYQLNRQ